MGVRSADYLVPRRRVSRSTFKAMLAAATTNATLGTVGFPDMPGKLGVDWQGYKKYAGAQRALFALLYANDTFGASVEWCGARARRNSRECFA